MKNVLSIYPITSVYFESNYYLYQHSTTNDELLLTDAGINTYGNLGAASWFPLSFGDLMVEIVTKQHVRGKSVHDNIYISRTDVA